MASERLPCDGLAIELLAERAVFLHASKALVVAHLHAAGETESGFGEEPLVRLSRCAMRMEARVIVILGQLTSASTALDDELMGRVAEFRQRCSLPIRHVRMSLSPPSPLACEWCIDSVREDFTLDGVRFSTLPAALDEWPWTASSQWCLSANARATVEVTTGERTSEVPACVVAHTTRTILLPPFSKFSRGTRVQASTGVTRYALHSNQVQCVESALA